MASERDSSDSTDFGPIYFEKLNLSDSAGARPKFRYSQRLALSANNSIRCSPQSDESSTSYVAPGKSPFLILYLT